MSETALQNAFEKAVQASNKMEADARNFEVRLDVLREEESRLLQTKGKHEQTLDKIPVALELLQALYTKSSGSLIKSCEEAMSDAVQAVVGDESRIGIDAEVQNNQIRVTIGTAQHLRDGSRVLRDIMSNEGGGLTNVVSTSLRAISIVRSGQRRFMVLDESNCWLNPKQIPAFSRIIQDIVNRVGFQIIMLTHHGVENFDDDTNIIHLDRTHNGVKVTSTYDADTETPGILSSIELHNYGRHPHLYIPLRAGLNVITGASNTGKSRILSALRAVICGTGAAGDIYMKETPDGFVDMEKSTKVAITFDGGKVVEWTRRKSGSPIENWSYTIPGIDGIPEVDGIICAGRNGTQWVGNPNVFNIQEIGGFYPALHIQKSASFALEDKKALASLIAISPTSVRLHNMIAIVSEKKKEANAEIRRLNIRLTELSQEIHILDRDLNIFREGLENAQHIFEDIKALQNLEMEMLHLHGQWNHDRKESEYEARICNLHLKQPEIIDIEGPLTLIENNYQDSVMHWYYSSLETCLMQDKPVLDDIDGMVSLCREYEACKVNIKQSASLESIYLEKPDIVDIEGPIALLQKYDIDALEHWACGEIELLYMEPPTLLDMAGPSNLYQQYNKSRMQYEIECKMETVVKDRPAHIIADIEKIDGSISLFKVYRSEQECYEKENEALMEIQNTLDEQKNIIVALRGEIKICPLCGHDCTAERTSHAHH